MKKRKFTFSLLCTAVFILQPISSSAAPLSEGSLSNTKVYATDTIHSPAKRSEEALLSDGRSNHILNKYVEASQKYMDILKDDTISKGTKLKAEAYLALAENSLPLSLVQKYTEDYLTEAAAANSEYIKNQYKYELISDYKATDEFLNAGTADYFYTHGILKMDKDGLPTVQYGNEFYYNPVTLSQFILTMHGRYIKTKDDAAKTLAIKCSNKLLELQSTSGAFRLNFPYHHYLNTNSFEPGWVSSMAQGQAISALLRIYDLTKDSKYLESANRSFNFMKTRVGNGGVLDSINPLNQLMGKPDVDSMFFQEYVTTPRSYTLNGFIYTMLGLYDLSQSESIEASTAQWYFELCEKSLRQTLKYYDVGNFTCYDLSYITNPGTKPMFNTSYHSIHIELMDTMYVITKNPIYKYYGCMWKSYVEP